MRSQIIRSARLADEVVKLPKYGAQAETVEIAEDTHQKNQETSNSGIDLSQVQIDKLLDSNEHEAGVGQSNKDAFGVEKSKPVLITDDEMTAVLNEEKEKARITGHEEGYGKGYEEGKQQANDELMQTNKKAVEFVINLEKQTEEVLKHNEDIMVEIVFTAICRILGHEMTNKKSAKNNIMNTIKDYKNNGKINLHVSQEDYEQIENTLKDKSLVKGFARIELIPDERVELGGCIVQTESGSIDARLDTQVNILKETLLKTRERMDQKRG